MKKLITIALLLCAAPLFAAFDAFLKADRFKGDSTDTAHQGWVAISGFSWGANAAPANVQGCASKEIHFTASPASVPMFQQALQTNETIPEMTLDFFNTRHSLQGAKVRAVQGNNVTIHFDGCETHAGGTLVPATTAVKNTTAAPQPPAIVAASLVNPNTTPRAPNAQVFVNGVPGEKFDLISLQLQGNNTAVFKVRESANGFFQRSAANSKKGTPSITFLRFKFDTVFTTKVQWNSDGTETVTLNYAKYAGPAEGYHQ